MKQRVSSHFTASWSGYSFHNNSWVACKSKGKELHFVTTCFSSRLWGRNAWQSLWRVVQQDFYRNFLVKFTYLFCVFLSGLLYWMQYCLTSFCESLVSNLLLYGYTLWAEIAGVYFYGLVIFCVVRKLIIAVRTDWFFFLGINFCDFQKVPSTKNW